ncbi:MAG TPA: response regulator [Deltaproteobacteria bacterium]|nr:response regulator [Deltaproteobacteria bacterium]
MDHPVRRALEDLLAHHRGGGTGHMPHADHPDPLVQQIRSELLRSEGQQLEIARLRSSLDDFVQVAVAYAQGDYSQILDEASGDVQVDAVALGLNQMAAEIRGTTIALAQARDAALDANTVQRSFFANTSHELRSLLNPIIGYAELLLEDLEDTRSLADDLDRILQSSRRLLEILNQILDISKMDDRRMELCPELFHVAGLCSELVETIRPLAGARDNVVELEIDPRVGTMFSDTLRVRQVLMNLLTNAVKFTEQGTIALRVEPVVEHGRDWVRFAVSDTGMGIAEQHLEAIFEPFVQAGRHAPSTVQGTGLGLAIARRLARMMGGEIALCSELGVGSTFELTLPLGHLRPGAPGERTDPTVLVVNDDPEVQELIGRHLARGSCSVVGAMSGPEALERISRHRPSVIVLDVRMPGMDGWELLSILKAVPETADIPVIMISFVEDRSRGIALGSTDYLIKPVGRERLVRAVERYLPPSGATALVVDDDAITREMARRVLAAEGWQVLEAPDGPAALRTLSLRRPDLVLLDLTMPRLGGFQVMGHIRATPELRDLPLVFTATELTASDRERMGRGLEQVLDQGSLDQEELLSHLHQAVVHSAR